jgi:hypothetical protein
MLKKSAYFSLIIALILAIWFLAFGGYFKGNLFEPDILKAKEIQPFITGLVLPLLTLGSTLLVIENLKSNTLQNFSNNFFKLIDLHHKLVGNIESQVGGTSAEGKSSKGRDFFDDLAEKIARDYEHLTSSLTTYIISKDLKEKADGESGKDLLMTIYGHYFHIHQSDLGHYFRNLYHIVRFVERSSPDSETKIEYIKMLRAQLSNYEILLLAYNGLHLVGKDFYPLIDKFELLKNLSSETDLPEDYSKRIIDINVLKKEYSHLKNWK